MLKKKKEKGITLISLVITVIILLILSAVAINLAVNTDGLFGKAGDAANKWNSSVATEGNELDNLIGMLDGLTPTYVHNWTRTGAQIACSHCDLTYTIGVSTIDYVSDEPTEDVVLSGEKSGTGADQVIYEVTATSKLDANVSVATAENNLEKQTGYTVEKAIKVENENEEELIEIASLGGPSSNIGEEIWVVLGIADEDEDGINESLLITSSEPVGEVTLEGAAAYNYGPEELKTICEKLYSSSTGTARSMTIEDVNEALRYTPEGGIYNYGSGNQTTGDFTTKLNELGSVWDSVKAKGTSTPDGTNTEEALGEYSLDGYYYHVGDGYLVSTDELDTSYPVSEITNEINLIFGSSRNYRYWLASRGVSVDGDGSDVFACFGPGYVGGGSARSFRYTFYSDGRVSGTSSPVRPVVSLKSEIPADEQK